MRVRRIKVLPCHTRRRSRTPKRPQAKKGAVGLPPVVEGPLAHLAAEFPLRPALAGNLIPSTINLWHGCSRAGASSGLHHDAHDNIYALCRGRKRFRLWPPRAIERLYPTGTPTKLWPNGRVVYEGQGAVCADGVDAALRRRADANEELEAAEAACARGEPGAEERLAEAERALDELLEESLRGGWQDDFDDLEEEEEEACLVGPGAGFI